MFRKLALVTAFVAAAGAAQAADKYEFDNSHTQVVFSWTHMGFSNPSARFEKVEGELLLDTADLTKSSVSVTLPIASIDSDVAKFDDHLRSDDFFDLAKFPTATFKSTKVEKAGDNKLKVTGDLTIHGVTKPAVLDVKINKIGDHPMAKKPAAGFDATTTIKRSDFGLGKYVPNVSDEVKIQITTETLKAG
ncbi:YceI family protein [Tahibacter amnicola]|uniref:YceI family protein n=1 Tax=Tahibacter amnicola TaxID=2976241 RepID=A0ABY6BHD3_9GAMM|nr:YceI family protein [Tahibacter amnicola]UXI68917.1 YceI family protein [Tahibacter amnicola]